MCGEICYSKYSIFGVSVHDFKMKGKTSKRNYLINTMTWNISIFVSVSEYLLKLFWYSVMHKVKKGVQ